MATPKKTRTLKDYKEPGDYFSKGMLKTAKEYDKKHTSKPKSKAKSK